MLPLDPAPRRAWPLSLFLYAAAWTALAATYAALYASMPGIGEGMALRAALAVVLPSALLGRLTLRLGRRWAWPLTGGRLAARIAPAVFAIAATATASWLVLAAVDNRLTRGTFAWSPPQIIVWQLVINTLIHTALAGIGYAWNTADEARAATARAAKADILRARAEFELLRSQLQPHFVGNVLHALLGLVRRDPSLAEMALERLGELLRYGQWVQQSGSDWIPLAREWDFVQSYLELERLRLGSRLHVDVDADPDALDVVVPAFALQPLVENAIVHGVAPRAEGGRVIVSARRADGRLSLAVEDDGPGASEAEIAASPRTGLRLLQERLAVLYRGRARLAFEPSGSGGFRARLDLPENGMPIP